MNNPHPDSVKPVLKNPNPHQPPPSVQPDVEEQAIHAGAYGDWFEVTHPPAWAGSVGVRNAFGFALINGLCLEAGGLLGRKLPAPPAVRHAPAGGSPAVADSGQAEQLLAALIAAHQAMDALMAMVIHLEPTFRPTKSRVWPAFVQVFAAIEDARAAGLKPAPGPSA